MNLTGTTQYIELGTSSAASTVYVCDWTDVDQSAATAIAPGSSQGSISSATDTTIVDAPAASVSRVVTRIVVRNADASLTQTVTIKKNSGGSEFAAFAATLAAGESFVWQKDGLPQVFDSSGRPRITQTVAANITNALNVVVLSTDVTNNNAVANTLADVTGLSFSVTAGETYWFRAEIPYTSAATTTGSRWTVNGPAAPTLLNYTSRYTLTATTETVNYATAFQIPAASNATSLTAGNVAIIEGFIKPSSSGTLQVQFASEVSSSAVVAKAGAVLEWMRVL